MQKTVEDINPTKKRFIVEVPVDVVESKITERLRDARNKVKIPGFRLGKAPLPLLERRLGQSIEEEVIEKVIPEYYFKAIKEEDVMPIAAPIFEHYVFKKKSPFKIIFTVEILPKIKDMKYEGFTVTDELVEIKDDEVEEAIERLKTAKPIYELFEGEIIDEDLVCVDYEILEEKQEVKGQFIKIGSKIIPQEISDELKGKKAGDTFRVIVSFPKGYLNKKMSGKTLSLKGIVKEVKRLKKAEVNDDFAKTVGYKDMNELRGAMRESLERAREEMLENKQKGEIIEQLVEANEFDLPESLLESELNALLGEEKRVKPDEDDDKLRKELRGKAIRNVRANILLDAITDKDKIDLKEEEVKDRILLFSKSMYLSPESFEQKYLQNESAKVAFRGSLLREKALKLLLDKAVKIKKKENDIN